MNTTTGGAVVELVDYRAGNLFSIRRALEFVGATVSVVRAPDDWSDDATHVVLPGVGAYQAGMDALRASGLDGGLRDRAERGMPLLGICLGAQLLFGSSEEFGVHEGLGLLAGAVRRLPVEAGRVPHIGWAACRREDGGHPVLSDRSDEWMYFVHSYVFEPVEPTRRLLASDVGGVRFTAAAGSRNVLGVQFHPERSGDDGLALLRRFCAWRGENA
jgi:glutamine amidotransferase